MKKLLQTLLLGGALSILSLPANAADTPSVLYMLGDCDGGGWSGTSALAMQKYSGNENVFYATNVQMTSATSYFAFTSVLSSDWDELNAARVAPSTKDAAFSTTDGNPFVMGMDASWQIPSGTYDFYVNFATNTVANTYENTLTAAATAMYVVGSSINGNELWATSNTNLMTYSSSTGLYTWEGESISGNFKIFDGDWDSDNNFGSNGSTITLGQPYSYTVNGGDISFGDATIIVKNPVVTLNTNAKTITVTGTQESQTLEIYVCGSWNGWGDANGDADYQLKQTSDGIFSGTLNVPSGATFKLVINNSWCGAGSVTMNGTNPVSTTFQMGGGDDISLSNWNGGDIIFTVDYNANKLTLTPVSASTMPEKLYLIGSPQGWDINGDSLVLEESTDGVYNGTFDVAAGQFDFRFYSVLGDWETNSIGSQVDDEKTAISLTNNSYSGDCVWGKGSWQYSAWLGGSVTITVNLNDMTVKFDCVEKPSYPDEVYLVGPFNSWDATNPGDYVLTAVANEEGVYEGTLNLPKTVNYNGEDVPSLNMKICIAKNWDVSYGGENFYLYKGANNPIDIKVTNDNLYCDNWQGGDLTVKVDLANMKVTFTTPDQPEAPDYDNLTSLYLVGNFNDWTLMDEEYIIPQIETGSKIYEASFNIPATVGDDNANPSFKVGTYDNWNYAYGYADEAGSNVVIYSNVPGSENLTRGEGTGNITLTNWEGGDLKVYIDLNTNVITLSAATQPKLQPESLWLVGPFNGWSLENQTYILEQTSDNSGVYEGSFNFGKTVSYEGEDVNPVNFKVAFGTSDDWSETFGQTGGDFPLYSTESVTTTLQIDGGNWYVSNWAGGDLNVTVDLNDNTITISGSDQPAKVAPGEVLYLIGAPQGWNINSDEMTLSRDDDGLYTGSFEIADNEFNFILYTALGDWESNYLGAPSTTGGDFEVPLTDSGYTGPISESKTNWLISNWEEASVTITVDVENMTISFGDITTGIDRINGSDYNTSGTEMIYNLQGVRIDRNKMTRGIYIINGKKVLVK